MDSSTTADNTTVVAGPSSESEGKQRGRGRSASHSDTTTHRDVPPAKNQTIPNDFVRAADYSLEERPFFVIIGHDGLIGALQKLDKQLVEVRFTSFLDHTYGTNELMLNSREEIKYYRTRNQSAGSARKLPRGDLASSTMEAFPRS